jgi:hypothetical protein
MKRTVVPTPTGPSLVCRASVSPGVQSGVVPESTRKANTWSTGRLMTVTTSNSFMVTSMSELFEHPLPR